MNLLLLDETDFIDHNTAKISGRRFEHLEKILGLEIGKSYRAGKVNGLLGKATAIDVEAGEATFKVELSNPSPAPLPVTLFCALPRPLSFRKVLHAAVSMGVKQLGFFQSWKVERSYWQSPFFSPEAVDKEIQLALEQCGDTIWPKLKFQHRFSQFIEEDLQPLVSKTRCLFGDPRAVEQLNSTKNLPTTLVVGPEGGFTEFEEEQLRIAGCRGVSIGTRVLRTEVAIPALLSRL